MDELDINAVVARVKVYRTLADDRQVGPLVEDLEACLNEIGHLRSKVRRYDEIADAVVAAFAIWAD